MSQTALAKADTVPRNVEGLLQAIIKFDQSLESAIIQQQQSATLVTERKKRGLKRQNFTVIALIKHSEERTCETANYLMHEVVSLIFGQLLVSLLRSSLLSLYYSLIFL